MARTLKEQYQTKRVRDLNERVKKIDANILQEHQTARLLLEKMDEDDLQKVAAIIDKLRSVKNKRMPILAKAIDTAETELNKYTGGGPLTQAWSKIKSKVGIDNPVVKISTFADALERGFKQIPLIIKNNVENVKDLDTSKSLQSLLTTPPAKKTGEKSDAEMGNTKFSASTKTGSPTVAAEGDMNEADTDLGSQKLKNVAQQILKALAPGGIFGAFKKIPYVNTQELVKELINVPLAELGAVVKKLTSGPQAAEVAPDMKDVAAGQGGVETKGSQPGAATTPSGQTTGTSPGKPTTGAAPSTPAGETPPGDRGGAAGKGEASQSVIKAFKALKDDDQVKGVDPLRLKAILDYLDERGMLK